MAAIRLIHWRAAEAEHLMAFLRAKGHAVDYDEAVQVLMRRVRERSPAVVVIDLSRLPSQGRAIAGWLGRTKSTCGIPIVFHGGAAEKVAAVSELFPQARYADGLAGLAAAIGDVLSRAEAGRVSGLAESSVVERGIANPARSAAQKLGIRAGGQVSVVDAPRDYARVLGALPEGVELVEEDAPGHPLTLWFVHDAAVFEARLTEARRWAKRTKLWVLWRKQATGHGVLTQLEIRRLASLFDLVDYKICAVDQTWSGMLFSLRK